MRANAPDKVPPHVLEMMVAYYIANKQEDSDWVVLPVTNFDAYFGTTTFSRKWLPALCRTAIVRGESGYGVSRFRLADGFSDATEGN